MDHKVPISRYQLYGSTPLLAQLHFYTVVAGCELTGDTVQFGQSVWGDAKKATIM